MRACTPATLDDILLAPSYPCPHMLHVGMLFSIKNCSIASEIAAPVIRCKGINPKNSSVMSCLLSRKRTHMAKCFALCDVTSSASME